MTVSPSRLEARRRFGSQSVSELGADLGRARQRREIKFADWPTVAAPFKMLIKWRVGLTLGLEDP